MTVWPGPNSLCTRLQIFGKGLVHRLGPKSVILLLSYENVHAFLAIASTFDSKSFPVLHVALKTHIWSIGRKMSFMFRTRDPQGTLMLVGNMTSDFVKVSVENGSISFSVSLGEGSYYYSVFLLFAIYPKDSNGS